MSTPHSVELGWSPLASTFTVCGCPTQREAMTQDPAWIVATAIPPTETQNCHGAPYNIFSYLHLPEQYCTGVPVPPHRFPQKRNIFRCPRRNSPAMLTRRFSLASSHKTYFFPNAPCCPPFPSSGGQTWLAVGHILLWCGHTLHVKLHSRSANIHYLCYSASHSWQ